MDDLQYTHSHHSVSISALIKHNVTVNISCHVAISLNLRRRVKENRGKIGAGEEKSRMLKGGKESIMP